MNAFTIKDLENLSGVKAHTLRIWEQRYQFLKPSRTFTNIRYYSNDELKTILNIALLNKYGFKISHIDKMSPEEINEKILSLNQQDAQKEKVVNQIKNLINTYYIFLGYYFTFIDTFIKKQILQKKYLLAIPQFLFLVLFIILSFEYNLRSSNRFIYYSIVLYVACVFFSKLKFTSQKK